MNRSTKLITILILIIGILIIIGCGILIQYVEVLTTRFDRINDILNMTRKIK